jgi:hypothetical protein
LGWYLQSFRHEAGNGRGFGKFTPHLHNALVFEDYEKAVEFYTRQSTTNPIRPDGKANRPMTGMHAEFIPVQTKRRRDRSSADDAGETSFLAEAARRYLSAR